MLYCCHSHTAITVSHCCYFTTVATVLLPFHASAAADATKMSLHLCYLLLFRLLCSCCYCAAATGLTLLLLPFSLLLHPSLLHYFHSCPYILVLPPWRCFTDAASLRCCRTNAAALTQIFRCCTHAADTLMVLVLVHLCCCWYTDVAALMLLLWCLPLHWCCCCTDAAVLIAP